MKLKTNKLLTLTLASSLVAITAGCGGSKAAAPKTGTTTTPPTDTIAYNDWTSGATQAADLDDNGFLAGNTAGTGLTLVPTTTPATVVETLTLNSTVTAATTTQGATKGLSPVTLGGEAADGVAFFTVPGTAPATDARYFAGLLANTDLGGPITATIASTNATWNGLFQAIGDAAHTTAATEFTLNVNFADNEISAHIEAAGAGDVFATGNNSYYLEGTFVTATGLITGNIIFGGYAAADAGASLALAVAALETATEADATGADTNGRGTVTGLIGAQGVLGAFHSNGTDGDGALGFAGGFVATTAANAGGTDPDAVYADWSGSATLVTAITANGFVAGSAKGLDLAAITATASTLDLNDVYEEGTAATPGDDANRAGTDGTLDRILPGEDTNGVAFTSMGTGDAARFFAGLHNTTDLGAPIAVAGDVTGTWNGLFQAVGATGYAVEKSFVLTVTFSADAANTISGLIPVGAAADTPDGANSYYLSGTYDTNGVITGNILYGDFATGNADATAALADAVSDLEAATATTGSPSTVGLGVLSGLIGKTEAVGAFHSSGSDGTGATGFAGGFVATKATIAAAGVDAATAFDPVSFADWTGSFTSPALPTAAISLATGTAPTTNAFVRGIAAGLSLPTAITTVALGLDSGTNLDGAATDGVAFGTSGTSTTQFYVAGVLNGTDLGGPITQASDVSGTWNGRFQAVGAAATHTTAVKDFILSVAFGAADADRTITGSIPAGDTATTVVNTAAYHIDANYDANGVITGKIIYATTATAVAGVAAAKAGVAATAGGGTVTGLIGMQGAVGAFISTNTTDGTGALGYSGGFVANN